MICFYIVQTILGRFKNRFRKFQEYKLRKYVYQYHIRWFPRECGMPYKRITIYFFSEIELSIVYSGFHELLDLQAIEEKWGPEDRNWMCHVFSDQICLLLNSIFLHDLFFSSALTKPLASSVFLGSSACQCHMCE